MSEERRTCRRCGKTKPLTDFSTAGSHYHKNICRPCNAEETRERRATQTRDELNAAQAAFRAGMRRDKCAVCGSAIEGHGICDACMVAIDALGGSPDALKRAAKALKWVQDQ